MIQHELYIRRLVDQGGPEDSDYEEFTEWIGRIHKLASEGSISPEDLAALRRCFGTALSASTMQGFALNKPHGYAGDFEVIDRIYERNISMDPKLANWDRYYHHQAAPEAVRNRKTYFHALLDRHYSRRKPLKVLKIASGPGRSMFEWLTINPTAVATFDCIEIDPEAIEYASSLNHQFIDRITFTQCNALRYRPRQQYDLIWAAGIFDYFPDNVFLSLMSRLLSALGPEGELVIGNFSDHNPSRPYMELMGDWHLHHRSAERLRSLASQSGVAPARISVGSEAQRVNLFLHVCS